MSLTGYPFFDRIGHIVLSSLMLKLLASSPFETYNFLSPIKKNYMVILEILRIMSCGNLYERSECVWVILSALSWPKIISLPIAQPFHIHIRNDDVTQNQRGFFLLVHFDNSCIAVCPSDRIHSIAVRNYCY